MFKLHIECSKDIDYLEINFSDGTSTITGTDPDVSKKDNKKTVHKNHKINTEKPKDKPKQTSTNHRDQLLDLDADFGEVSQEIVELPKIDVGDRPIKVADELQNMDF